MKDIQVEAMAVRENERCKKWNEIQYNRWGCIKPNPLSCLYLQFPYLHIYVSEVICIYGGRTTYKYMVDKWRMTFCILFIDSTYIWILDAAMKTLEMHELKDEWMAAVLLRGTDAFLIP